MPPLTDAGLEPIARFLNRFPEVVWDRCVAVLDSYAVYGWIARDDGRSDFLVLRFEPSPGGLVTVDYTTSSAELSPVFAERICGDASAHVPCVRVESVFGDAVERKVVLAEPPRAQSFAPRRIQVEDDPRYEGGTFLGRNAGWD